MVSKPTLLIVDDDSQVRASLHALLKSAGYHVKEYASAQAVLKDDIPTHCLIVTDLRMPEMDGIELQREITRRGIGVPVIVLTGHGEIALAVRAMKEGAFEFFEKPVDDEALLRCIDGVFRDWAHWQSRHLTAISARKRVDLLSPREKEVFGGIVSGKTSKEVACDLKRSPRTIEEHRRKIMKKLGAKSLPDLVRIAVAASPLPVQSQLVVAPASEPLKR